MLATILGFLVGIARLSKNFLLSKLSAGYVELIRNMPLLLQLLFWYNAVLKALPDLRDSWTLPGSIFLNNRGLFAPSPVFQPGMEFVGGAFIVGIVGALGYRNWARKKQERTGAAVAGRLVALGLIIGLPLIAFFLAGMPATLEFPEKGRFNIRGGMEILPEFVALLFGLVASTPAPSSPRWCAPASWRCRKGQTEAADALGLRTGPTLQAGGDPAGDARDHPAADQPVSEPDQELLAGGRSSAIPTWCRSSPARCSTRPARRSRSSMITMAVYLTISLVTSRLMNWYNARIALVER